MNCCRCGKTLPASRVLRYCTDCNRAYQAQWKARNPGAAQSASARWRERTGYNAVHAERRRADLRGRSAFKAVAKGTDEDAYLLVVAKDPCAYCGAPATELDHVVPGVDEVENVAAACRTCNARKGTLSLLGWLTRRCLIEDGFDEMREQWARAA